MLITPILIWWFILLIFGLVGWPLAYRLLGRLPDRGFAFIRPVGLLLSGYILWLGGSFRILQNSLAGILLAMLLTLILGLAWQGLAWESMLSWLRREWRYALTVELLFGLTFVGWAVFKAYNPNIETAGGEKWMEIAFINGVLNSDYFPPHDPWLSGFAISYYYFGYVLMAMLTRLSGLVSTTAFNLYVPSLFAMSLSGAFGIVANLVAIHCHQESGEDPPPLAAPAIMSGLFGSLFVGVLGNLEGLLEVLHKRQLLSPAFWQWLDILNLREPPEGAISWIPDRFMWWWRGSRVILDYTLTGQEQEMIDEFPFFSFMLADVHPHVLALPFALLVIALALNLLRATPEPGDNGEPSQGWRLGWRAIVEAMGGRLGFGLYALCLGALSFLNTWDFPIYLGVMGLTLLLWLSYRLGDWDAALLPGVIGAGLLGVSAVLLYLPFYATFQSQAKGILPNLWNPTRLPQFFVFFGPFLVAGLGLLLLFSIRLRGWPKPLRWTMPLAVVGPVVALLIVLGAILISPAGRAYVEGILHNPTIQAHLGGADLNDLLRISLIRRLKQPLTFLLLGGLLGWTAALLIGGKRAGRNRLIEKFALILLLAGLGLPLVVEFIYLRDNFGYRMNTVFKFYFQGWVLLALASAFAMYYVPRYLTGLTAAVWLASMGLLIAGGMVYPLLATLDKANYFRDEPTLNGIAWVGRHYPDDYAGIEWVRENAPEEAVILEAPGSGYDAYKYVGRVSALTGRSTLLGWGGHQSQWRGNYDEPARREPDIEQLFNTTNLKQTQNLLDKYGIDYVYIGPLERRRYAAAGLRKFDHLMEVAFAQGDVVIYKRR